MLNCRVLKEPFLCTLPIVRLRSGLHEYARIDGLGPPGLVPFAWVETRSKRLQISVPSGIHQVDFIHQNFINYMDIISFPSKQSGYDIADFYPPTRWHANAARFDIESGIISASPFPNTFCGAVICFKHETNACLPFMVALFADGPPEDGDCMAQDVVGVFSGVSPEDFFLQFHDWRENCSAGDLASAISMLSNAAEMIVHNRAWKLDDGTFVRVAVHREHERKVDSIAVAEILAGTSWERDIERLQRLDGRD